MNEQKAIQTAQQVVDFTRSIPPMPPILHAHLKRTLRALSEENDIGGVIRTSQSGGIERDREAGAAWLAPRFGEVLDPTRVVVTCGTQASVSLLFDRLVGRDGLVLAETLSWGAISGLARRADVRLKGLPIDDEGIIPEAFEAACKRYKPKALYCNPTDQNPTTAIMPVARRMAIAEIARRHGVPIIEDDAIGRLHVNAPLSIAALAPDIAWYVMGLTKCLAQGLRMAFMVGPSASDIERVIGPERFLSYWAPAPLSAAVVSRWIAEGAADEICAAIRAESVARAVLAAEILGMADIKVHPMSMHVWLRLGARINRHMLTESLKQMNVLIRPAELFAIDDTPPPNAVRLSLSSPDRGLVRGGLAAIAAALEAASAD